MCKIFIKVLGSQKFRGFYSAGALSLSALLLGCVGTETKSIASSADELNATTLKQKPTHELSTKDKPTRTIETPWGAREIYDPAQDKDVLAAFERVVFSKKYPKSVLKDPIIGSAYNNYMQSLSKINCKTLINPFCEMCVVKNVQRRDRELHVVEEKAAICSRVDYNSMNEEKYCANLNLLNVKNNTKNLSDFFQMTCIKWNKK